MAVAGRQATIPYNCETLVRGGSKLTLLMNPVRRVLAAFSLALALLAGQQAAVLHGLAHATVQSGSIAPGAPGNTPCDQCFLSAQLSGALGAAIAAMPGVVSGSDSFVAAVVEGAPGAPRFAFRARAPPTLL